MSSPDWLNHGDNAWQMVAATLVGLQSVPGLVILYGGVVKKKWAINSAFMVFYAFGATMVCWVVWAYKMGFGNEWFFAIGEGGPALGGGYLTGQSILPTPGLTQLYPMAAMVYFQFVFAAITVILLGGALLGRMNFLAWCIFVPLWVTLSYTVGSYSLWAGGFLFKWGVLDYSGGFVIHLSSGTGGFVAAYWVGPRLQRDRERFPPNNTLLVMAGAGLLWLGWNGFNGGDPYSANQSASIAVLNTNIATAMSMLVWVMWDYLYFRKPSVIGAVQGMITGLVTITPGAGFVHGWGAVCYGFMAGSVPWFTMMILGKRWWLLNQVDDTLGALHTHAVAGLLGGTLTGLFAVEELCSLFGSLPGTHGAWYGGWGQLGKQLAGASFISIWNIIATSLICNAIRLIVPLRMTDEHLQIGDEAVHGEEAYAMYGDGDEDGKAGSWYGYDVTHHGTQHGAQEYSSGALAAGGAAAPGAAPGGSSIEMQPQITVGP